MVRPNAEGALQQGAVFDEAAQLHRLFGFIMTISSEPQVQLRQTAFMFAISIEFEVCYPPILSI